MPGIYYGRYGEQHQSYTTPDGGNAGRWPLGHNLVLPDGRVYCFTYNAATADVAGNLYQGALPIANHNNRQFATAEAVGSTVVDLDVGATAGARDLYMEGYVHTNDAAGEGYAYRIRRAFALGDAHAAIAGSDSIDVNLTDGESILVALTAATSEGTYTHNRFRNVLIHDSPPTAQLAGVAAIATGAARWGWYQVQGPAAVLTQGIVVIGDFCVPSATVDGAVMPSAAFETDGPYVGIVAAVNADTEYSLINLHLSPVS